MTRRTMRFLALIPAMTIALAACNAAATASPSVASPSAAGGGGAASGSANPAGMDLVGTAWALSELPGQVLNDVRPTIAFSGDGTVSGSGGCNNFNGTYTVTGSTLKFGPLASTQKACGDPADQIEHTYLAALQATTTYQIADNKLQLTGGPTALTFSVQQ